MELSLYQIDAFASKLFEGNPAAVVPLDEWLPDKSMQSIAEENNLSEIIVTFSGHRLRTIGDHRDSLLSEGRCCACNKKQPYKQSK